MSPAVTETLLKAAAMKPTGSPPLTGQKFRCVEKIGRGNMAHTLWINFFPGKAPRRCAELRAVGR